MMDPLLGPMITGGASLLGSIFNSNTTAQNTQAQLAGQEQMLAQTEQFNAGQVQQQEAYQTQMSNTAYQRASQDMKAAGLNPAMMFSSGGPASSPAGGAAGVGTPGVPLSQKQSPLAGLGQAAATAMDTMVKNKQIDYLTSQVASTDTATKLAATKLPGAESQQLLDEYYKSFLQHHPIGAEAIGVGPHIGTALDETLRPGFDALQSVWGGLGGALKGLYSSAKTASGKDAGSAIRSLSPADEAGSSSATAVRRGMDLERAINKGNAYEWKPDWKGMAEFFRNNPPGGRSPGTGGSFD